MSNWSNRQTPVVRPSERCSFAIARGRSNDSHSQLASRSVNGSVVEIVQLFIRGELIAQNNARSISTGCHSPASARAITISAAVPGGPMSAPSTTSIASITGLALPHVPPTRPVAPTWALRRAGRPVRAVESAERCSSEHLTAGERLESTQGVGSSFPTARHPASRRILLPKSRCHIYFEIDEAKQGIKILHICDGRRGQAPKLRAGSSAASLPTRRRT
jgi:hypothetical protein